MKVPTENSYSQPPTRSKLTLFTGKGGVGKTTLALSYALWLKNQGLKVIYSSFDDVAQGQCSQELGLTRLDLYLEKSAKEYIANKLGSEIIASWIMKTPFFKALLHIMPGLAQMILLGHIINIIEKDPELYIVLDSPATGHTMSLLESPKNFKDMFREGLIVSDINKMYRFLNSEKNFSLKIIMLPNEMAIQEGHELSKNLMSLNYPKATFIMNNLISQNEELMQLKYQDIPVFLQLMIEAEKQFLCDHQMINLPHISHSDQKEIIISLIPYMEKI